MTHVFRIEHEHTDSRIAQHRQFICLLQQPIPSSRKCNLQLTPLLFHAYSLQLLIFNLLDLAIRANVRGEGNLDFLSTHDELRLFALSLTCMFTLCVSGLLMSGALLAGWP